MGYRKIPNLYKDKRILEFKRVYATQKIDGSTWWVDYDCSKSDPFSIRIRGINYEMGIGAFNVDELRAAIESRYSKIRIYGEGYGGKLQGQSKKYGTEPRFVAFDVLIGDIRLDVPTAHEVCKGLNLDFVYYELIPTDIDRINEARDWDDRQAVGDYKESEGIVLRPPFEVRLNNGGYLAAKHKKDKFRETKNKRELTDEELKVLRDAKLIAEEWVVPMRLRHVADKIEREILPENIPFLIQGMFNDVKEEAAGEIVWSKAVEKAIGKRTAQLVKKILQDDLT